MVYKVVTILCKMICIKCKKSNTTTKCPCGSYAMYYKKRVSRSIYAR